MVFWLAALAGIAGMAGGVPAVSAPPPGPQETAQAVYAKVAPSVLLVVAHGPDGQPLAQGSGFVIEGNLIVTNAHVVRGGTPAVRTGVATIPCALIRLDEKNDLAVLRPSATLSVAALRAANPGTPIGTRVFAIGNPQGLERTITEGIYSGPRRLEGATLLQISAPISQGSSGGPVVDSNGLVVGVAVGSLEGQNLNFAVPVDTLIELLAQPEMGAARPLAAGPAPAQPPAAAPAPASVTAPPPGGTTADHLRAFEVVLKERLAIYIEPATEARWRELHTREETLLIAAVTAARTDDEFRAVLLAAVPNQHDNIGLFAAKQALQRAPVPLAWHYYGIANAALGYAGVNEEPKKTELLKEAKDAVLKALPLNGASATWALAGRIHDELREWSQAKSAFTLAYSIGPLRDDRPAVLRGLWRGHGGVGEWAEADRWFGEYVATGRATDADYFDQANILATTGRMSEGAAMAAKIAANPRQLTGKPAYELWYWVTYAHWKANEDKAALLAAAETMRASPDTPEARRTAAMAATIAASIQITQADYTGAAESAGFAITADPTFSSAYSQLAKIQLASQRFVEAEREARKAISLAAADTDAEAYYVLGQALGAQRQWIPAAEALIEAARIDAANPYPAFNAAISLENAGRTADALRWYEEALRRDPNMKERDQIRAIVARLKGGG
ncbi:MAG TPA: tetratricopeptide repeat-containing serine protease family protein [Vicinamibacterales bacterium]